MKLKNEIYFLFTSMDAFIEEAMTKEKAWYVFSEDNLLKVLKILGAPQILPDKKRLEYHVTCKFKGKRRALTVHVEKSCWVLPDPEDDDDEYGGFGVVGYDIYTFHEE